MVSEFNILRGMKGWLERVHPSQNRHTCARVFNSTLIYVISYVNCMTFLLKIILNKFLFTVITL